MLLEKIFVGKDGFEPPKSKDSRFTVCPIWPLWNLPVLSTCFSRLHLRARVTHFFSRCKGKVLSWNLQIFL